MYAKKDVLEEIQTLRQRRVPPEVVAATGGWTSLAFLIYWRRMEEILPMCTSKAYNASHVNQLTAIFEEFRIQNHISNNDLSLY